MKIARLALLLLACIVCASAAPLLFHGADEAYVARTEGQAVRVTRRGFNIAVGNDTELVVSLLDTSPAARLQPEAPHADATAAFERLRIVGAYAGVDAVFYTSPSGSLEFDFVLQPGADPAPIALRVLAPAAGLSLSDDGHLIAGAFVLPRPVVYQPPAQRVDGGYRIDGDVVRFWLGIYDAALPLVIDPVVYSSFLGSDKEANIADVAVDTSGAFIVTGVTGGNFPVTLPVLGGGIDAFVTKFAANGALVFSTYLGGPGTDAGGSVAVNTADNSIYVVGFAGASGFPTTTGAFDVSYNEGFDAFLSKLLPNGTLVYSTFIGGSGFDGANGVAVDASDGSVVVVGQTNSAAFPVSTGATQLTLAGTAGNAFVVKFNRTMDYQFGTYLGGVGVQLAHSVAVRSADGAIVVVGQTDASDFPVSANALSNSLNGPQDGFVSIYSPAGALLFSSYFGGDEYDECRNVAINSVGHIVIVGGTNSSSFRVTLGAQQPSLAGLIDGFLTVLSNNGTSIIYSTYLGGSADDYAYSVAIDQQDSVFVSGSTESIDFPARYALQQNNSGHRDAFVTKFAGASYAMVFSTYWGGSLKEDGFCVATDAAGNVVLAGGTNSSNYTTTAGSFMSSFPEAPLTGFFMRFFECGARSNCQAPNGNCIGPNSCQCSSGWITPDCSQPVCLGANNCSGNGDCIGFDVCSCNPGWTSAPDCSLFDCLDSGNCFGHGACAGPNVCNCSAGWGDANCSTFDCVEVGNCSGHGTCVGPNVCNCSAGWGGVNCSQPTCSGVDDCSGHGACIDVDTCSCDTGWSTPNCSVPLCDKLGGCSPNGVCVAPNRCRCFANWTGANCSTPFEPTSSTTAAVTTTSASTTTTTITRTGTGAGNCSVDSDGDGVVDCDDACPNNAAVHVLSACGCYPPSACNCAVGSCPTTDYHGSSDAAAVNVTVTLPTGSTDAVVTASGEQSSFQLRLGWGQLREVATDGRTVKGLDPNDQSWQRVTVANATYLRVEYDSGLVTRPPWSAQPIHVWLVFEVFFTATASKSADSSSAGFELKYSVRVDGDWQFESVDNTLHVDFVVQAPTAGRQRCGVTEKWRLVSQTPDAKTYRVFMENRTAATIRYLTHCTADQSERAARVSKPKFTAVGWNTTAAFPSFNSSLFYDPSFALLLGYGDQLCDPLMSWILPSAFIAAAAAIIVLAWLLLLFPPVSKAVLGERGYQIRNIRKEIKEDYKHEQVQPKQSDSSRPRSISPLANMQVITNDEDL